MVDSLSRSARSALMSRIRGKNTAPELAVRRELRPGREPPFDDIVA